MALSFHTPDEQRDFVKFMNGLAGYCVVNLVDADRINKTTHAQAESQMHLQGWTRCAAYDEDEEAKPELGLEESMTLQLRADFNDEDPLMCVWLEGDQYYVGADLVMGTRKKSWETQDHQVGRLINHAISDLPSLKKGEGAAVHAVRWTLPLLPHNQLVAGEIGFRRVDHHRRLSSLSLKIELKDLLEIFRYHRKLNPSKDWKSWKNQDKDKSEGTKNAEKSDS
jgi:hypothetical protein